MSAYRVALETMRRATNALAGDPSPEERAGLVAMLADAVDLLEASADRRHLSTDALAKRVADLEHQLGDRDAGERREAICARLGISRSHFYRLRSPGNRGLRRGRLES